MCPRKVASNDSICRARATCLLSDETGASGSFEDHARAHGQGRDRCRYLAELPRHILAAPREDRDLAPSLVELDAPAVEFDLMNPARAAGRDRTDTW